MAHVTLKDVTKIYDGDVLAVVKQIFKFQMSASPSLSAHQAAANRRFCG